MPGREAVVDASAALAGDGLEQPGVERAAARSTTASSTSSACGPRRATRARTASRTVAGTAVAGREHLRDVERVAAGAALEVVGVDAVPARRVRDRRRARAARRVEAARPRRPSRGRRARRAADARDRARRRGTWRRTSAGTVRSGARAAAARRASPRRAQCTSSSTSTIGRSRELVAQAPRTPPYGVPAALEHVGERVALGVADVEERAERPRRRRAGRTRPRARGRRGSRPCAERARRGSSCRRRPRRRRDTTPPAAEPRVVQAPPRACASALVPLEQLVASRARVERHAHRQIDGPFGRCSTARPGGATIDARRREGAWRWPSSRRTRTSEQQIVADAKEFVLYSWSVQDQINPIAVAGAEGRHFWDYDGNRYLDFASQLVNVNIGHQHPRIIQAIKDQADLLCTIGPPMANESRSRLGRMLAEVTPGDLSVSFFTNGGAEANENAVKLARLVTGRHKIIARYRSYHGATNGAVTLTGDPRRWAVEPGMPGRRADVRPVHVPLPSGPPRSLPGLHRRAAPRGDPRVRGRAHGRRRDPRDGDRDERDHPAARRLPRRRSARSATGTGSC